MTFVVAHHETAIDGASPVALVTGAAKNIGHAIAANLAAAGFAIVATALAGPDEHARPEDPVVISRDQAERLGSASRWDMCLCDLSCAEDCTAIVAYITGRFGRLDCLVNNAGTWVFGDATETSDEQWRAVLEVNVVAPARLVRHAYPLLKSAPHGRVINVGSVSGFVSDPGSAAYCTSKAALHGLTRSLAVELARDGITVNAIAPGHMETSTNEVYQQRPDLRTASLARIPLERFGPTADVGELAGFLASAQASYLTGVVIPCDGGLLASVGR